MARVTTKKKAPPTIRIRSTAKNKAIAAGKHAAEVETAAIRGGKVHLNINLVELTLAERGSRYGDFSNHAAIVMDLKDRMRKEVGWNRLSQDKQQTLDVIADKVARILNGDPEYRDNWHDIQGYAKLSEDRCVNRATPE